MGNDGCSRGNPATSRAIRRRDCCATRESPGNPKREWSFHGPASIIKTRRDIGYATSELRGEGSTESKDLPWLLNRVVGCFCFEFDRAIVYSKWKEINCKLQTEHLGGIRVSSKTNWSINFIRTILDWYSILGKQMIFFHKFIYEKKIYNAYIMINSKVNLKHGVYHVIIFLCFSIYIVDR